MVLRPFAFAHGGCQVEEFQVGPAETTDECADLAVGEGWAERLSVVAGFADIQPPETAALPAAPETAAAAPKRRKA